MPSIEDLAPIGSGGSKSKSSSPTGTGGSRIAGLAPIGSGGSGGGKKPEKQGWYDKWIGINPRVPTVKGVVGQVGRALKPLGIAAETAQALGGASNLSTGRDRGRLGNAASALGGDYFGIAGKGAGNTVANLGLDLLDPLIFLSGGAKAAKFGSRLLVEGGAENLAVKAAGKGLTAADQTAARSVIRDQLIKGGGADLATRSFSDKVAHRFVGEAGEDLAVNRAMRGLVKEGRGGMRFAGKTVIPGSAVRSLGATARKVPALGMVDDAARAALVPRAEVIATLGADKAAILRNAQSKATGQLDTHIGEVVRPLKAEIKRAKLTEAELAGPVREALERPGTAVDPRFQPVVDLLRGTIAADTTKIVDSGLLPKEFLHTAGYLHRMPTKAGQRVLAEMKRGGQATGDLAKALGVDGSLKARTFLPDATIPEAEAAMRGLLDGAGKNTLKKGETFYEHNPLKATVSHSAAVERGVGQKGVLQSMADVPGGGMVQLVDTPTTGANTVASIVKERTKAQGRLRTAKNRVARTEGALAKEGPARPLGGPLGAMEPYVLDPVERLRLSQKLIDQKAAVTTLQDEIATLTQSKVAAGKANAAASAAKTAPEGWVSVTVGESTAYVHPAIGREINGIERLVGTPEATNRFIRHYDEVQNFWRANVTVLPIAPGFFMRNFQGNIVFNAIDGVSVLDYVRALSIQRGVQKANKLGVPVENVLTAENARLFRGAESHNVYNQGAQAADLEHVFPDGALTGVKAGASKLTRGVRLNGNGVTARNLPLFGTERAPVQAGRAVNSVIENNARLANYIRNTKQTGSISEGARRTRETLFDYGDLTPFEQKYMRRVAGFYTFMRKSSGSVLREMAHDPAKLNRITNYIDASKDVAGYGVDNPFDSGFENMTLPFGDPKSLAGTLGAGGYAGTLRGQVLGTPIKDKETGKTSLISPGDGSEDRKDMVYNALMPTYGKYGRVERTLNQSLPGEKQDLLRFLLGVSPQNTAYADSSKTAQKKKPGKGILGQAPR